MMSVVDAIRRIGSVSDSGRAGDAGRRFTVTFGPGDTWVGIEDSPARLAASAGVSLDIYALARLSKSENSRHGPAYRLAVCEVGRNEARRRGLANAGPARTHTPAGNLIFRTNGGKFDRTAGHFGQQRGRWAATLLDPTPSDVEAARLSLQSTTDLTKGATKFFSPFAQDGGTQGGRKLRRDARGVIAEWMQDGNEWIGPVPGINPYLLFLMRRARDGRPTRTHIDRVLNSICPLDIADRQARKENAEKFNLPLSDAAIASDGRFGGDSGPSDATVFAGAALGAFILG